LGMMISIVFIPDAITTANEPQEMVYQVDPEYPLEDGLVIITEQEQLPTQRILWMRVVEKTETGYLSVAHGELGVQDGNLTVLRMTCPVPEDNVDCWRLEINRVLGQATICRLYTLSGGGSAVHSFACSQ